jgi:mono/diheme cytochrome c family protein
VRYAPIVLTTLALAGCGGGSSSGDDGGGSPKAQFAGTCGNCHTLADAGTTGTFGPDLDELAPSEEQVRTAIAEGPGSMPSGLLDGAAADAVARYVAGASGG